MKNAAKLMPPEFPAGAFQPPDPFDETTKATLLEDLAAAPGNLRDAVAGLSDEQLDTKYRNWSIRQIVHHIADSHLNSYVRFKWALTENNPTIKAYDEGEWSNLPDATTLSPEPSLDLLSALHDRWVYLVRQLSDEKLNRTFIHPESGETVSLRDALAYYAWHGRHHTGQILWIRETNDWS